MTLMVSVLRRGHILLTFRCLNLSRAINCIIRVLAMRNEYCRAPAERIISVREAELLRRRINMILMRFYPIVLLQGRRFRNRTREINLTSIVVSALRLRISCRLTHLSDGNITRSTVIVPLSNVTLLVCGLRTRNTIMVDLLNDQSECVRCLINFLRNVLVRHVERRSVA